ARGPRPRGDAGPRLSEGPARHGRRGRSETNPRRAERHARPLPGTALPAEPLAAAPRAARRVPFDTGELTYARRRAMLDAYLYDGLRSPIGRHAGKLAPLRPDDLAGAQRRELAGVAADGAAKSVV